MKAEFIVCRCQYQRIYILIDGNPCSHNRKFPGLFLSLNLSSSVLLLCVMHRLRWIMFGYSRIESTILMGLNETNTRISARSTSQHTHWYENARKRTGTFMQSFWISVAQLNTAQHSTHVFTKGVYQHQCEQYTHRISIENYNCISKHSQRHSNVSKWIGDKFTRQHQNGSSPKMNWAHTNTYTHAQWIFIMWNTIQKYTSQQSIHGKCNKQFECNLTKKKNYQRNQTC